VGRQDLISENNGSSRAGAAARTPHSGHGGRRSARPKRATCGHSIGRLGPLSSAADPTGIKCVAHHSRLTAQYILFGVGRVVSDQKVGMSRIIKCARTGLAAGAVTLLTSHAAFAAQINIHVPTPVIHVPTPVIHLPPPTARVLVPNVHVKTPDINVGAGTNHTLEGGAHGLVSRDDQNAQKSTTRQLQKTINNPDSSTSLPKQTSTISTPMGLSTAALQGPANGGTPSGGGGIGWSELAALLGKDRINTAFSFHPSRPTVYPGTGGASFYSGVAPCQFPTLTLRERVR
jgi:hypothetical protein